MKIFKSVTIADAMDSFDEYIRTNDSNKELYSKIKNKLLKNYNKYNYSFTVEAGYWDHDELSLFLIKKNRLQSRPVLSRLCRGGH